jgi:16S rRNA processing protein RimM
MIAPGDAGDVVVVGRIAGAFGVRGWVRVQSFTDPPENLLEYDPWLLESSDGWRPAGRQQARSQSQGLVAELRGVQDRDAAEALKGVLIGVPSSSLPGTGSDEYYWRDLIGLSVLDLDGEPLGRVVEMLATGANDVMVVALEPGGERELIPFDRRYVPEVNLAGGFVRVDWVVGDYR